MQAPLFLLDIQVVYIYMGDACSTVNNHTIDISQYVTGFWKTDQVVTPGLFHFITPAKSHSCTAYAQCQYQPQLMCFSRVNLLTL